MSLRRGRFFSIRLRGVKELKKQLEQIEQLVVRKELKRIARESFKIVLTYARERAPEDSGLLRKRIKMRVVTLKEGGVAVGLYLSSKPDTLKGAKKPEARNWAWFERGIPSRGIGAQPFFRSSLDSNADAVVSKFREEMKLAIDKVVRSTTRKPR
jgi:HK97 gp10 family phage protein